MATKESIHAALASKWLDPGLCTLANHESSLKDLYLFIYALQDLCVPPKEANGSTSAHLRNSAWQQLDINGNNLVSLAETGKWVLERVIGIYCPKEMAGLTGMDKSSAELLYKHFYPCFIRAFLDAADYGAATKVTQKDGGKSYSNSKTTGDDYVQYKEFRLLCTYLCIYATIWEAFGNLDGAGKGIDAADDRRISIDEWTGRAKTMIGHPLASLSISGSADPAKVFAAMDSDGKGKVLLSEFSTYIEDYEFALGTRWGTLLNAGEKVKASAGVAAAATSASS